MRDDEAIRADVEAATDIGTAADDAEYLIWHDAVTNLLADVPDLLAEVVRLRTELADMAQHGLRCDLNPTMDCRDVGTLYTGFTRYLRRLDDGIRDRAATALSSASTPEPCDGVCRNLGCTDDCQTAAPPAAVQPTPETKP